MNILVLKRHGFQYFYMVTKNNRKLFEQMLKIKELTDHDFKSRSCSGSGQTRGVIVFACGESGYAPSE